jgi:hypothetical protein
MKQPGATKDDVAKEESRATAIVGRFKELGEYHHRCLLGPKRRESITYPTFRQDFETQQIVPSYNSIVLPPQSSGIRTIVDTLASLERKIAADHGASRDTMIPQFKRTTRYIYVVLSRDLTNGDKPWLGAWEYPSTISKDITNFQAEVSTRDKSKLRYGPYWTWDVIVTKKIDEELAAKTSNKQLTTRYTAQIDPECMVLAGKIPVEAVEDPDFFDKHPDLLKDIYSKVFTPEEVELIDAYELEIDSLVNPIKSNEEIVKIFNDFPINLEAKDANGAAIFKYKDDLYEEITKLGHRLLANDSSNVALPEHEDSVEQIVEEVFDESKEEIKPVVAEPTESSNDW